MRWALLFVLSACGRFGFDPATASDGQLVSDGAVIDTTRDGAAAMVVTPQGQAMNAGSTTLTVANVSLTTGDALIVVTHRRIQDTTSVTWNGITLTEDEPIPLWGSGPNYVSVWSLYVGLSATSDVVSTGGGISEGTMFVYAVSQPQVAPFDRQVDGSGTGTSAMTVVTQTTTAPHELLIEVVASDGILALDGTWDPMFTEISKTMTPKTATAVAVAEVTAAGKFGVSYTNMTSRTWGAALTTYKLP